MPNQIIEEMKRQDFVEVGGWLYYEDGLVTEAHVHGPIMQPKTEKEKLTNQRHFLRLKIGQLEEQIKGEIDSLRRFVQDHLGTKKFTTAVRRVSDVFSTLKPRERNLKVLRRKLSMVEDELAKIPKVQTEQEKYLEKVQAGELAGEQEAMNLLDEINGKVAALFGDETKG